MNIKDELKKLQAQSDEATSRIKELKEALTEPDYKYYMDCENELTRVDPKSLKDPEISWLANRGLLFDTAGEARKYDDYLLALAKVVKAIKAYNGGWKADFGDYNQPKCAVNLFNNLIEVVEFRSSQYGMRQLHIKDRKGAIQIMGAFEEEIRTILSY